MNLHLGLKTHQDYAIVIDKSGKVRGMFDATSKNDCQRLRTMLLKCLEEEPPSKDESSQPNKNAST